MTRVVDEAPLSEFITKMRDVFRRRLAAQTSADKHAIEREMAAVMRQYLGRSAWDAAAAADEESAIVPRATSVGSADRKMLAAGLESE